jgi:hypothetical protein
MQINLILTPTFRHSLFRISLFTSFEVITEVEELKTLEHQEFLCQSLLEYTSQSLVSLNYARDQKAQKTID